VIAARSLRIGQRYQNYLLPFSLFPQDESDHARPVVCNDFVLKINSYSLLYHTQRDIQYKCMLLNYIHIKGMRSGTVSSNACETHVY